MPIQIEWVEQRILLATYSGILSADESRQAAKQRIALLEQSPNQIILVADVQRLAGLEAHGAFLKYASPIGHTRINHTFIAISSDLFRTVRRAIEDTPNDAVQVSFVTQIDTALAHAREWVARLD